MKITNLKAPGLPSSDRSVPPGALPVSADRLAELPAGDLASRQVIEIELLKARIQHLELVVETARGLMSTNQERLLRRLHEIPREIVALSAQLRRVDPQAAW